MNFADAIRQAAYGGSFHPEQYATSQPSGQTYTEEPSMSNSKPNNQVEETSHMPQNTMVRMELFLSPEQLSALFKAVVSTQHSVMTLREAASYLRINPATLEQMAQHGDVAAFQVNGRWRFPKPGLDEWVTLNTFRKEDADVA